eukprot:Lithocolla_globosa_v1_NODE_313_length_4540_cov_17.716005.p2 type:complete len:635 gc:universal NODE_313_length_4540_cov_17.716005:534-2438(+)
MRVSLNKVGLREAQVGVVQAAEQRRAQPLRNNFQTAKVFAVSVLSTDLPVALLLEVVLHEVGIIHLGDVGVLAVHGDPKPVGAVLKVHVGCLDGIHHTRLITEKMRFNANNMPMDVVCSESPPPVARVGPPCAGNAVSHDGGLSMQAFRHLDLSVRVELETVDNIVSLGDGTREDGKRTFGLCSVEMPHRRFKVLFLQTDAMLDEAIVDHAALQRKRVEGPLHARHKLSNRVGVAVHPISGVVDGALVARHAGDATCAEHGQGHVRAAAVGPRHHADAVAVVGFQEDGLVDVAHAGPGVSGTKIWDVEFPDVWDFLAFGISNGGRGDETDIVQSEASIIHVRDLELPFNTHIPRDSVTINGERRTIKRNVFKMFPNSRENRSPQNISQRPDLGNIVSHVMDFPDLLGDWSCCGMIHERSRIIRVVNHWFRDKTTITVSNNQTTRIKAIHRFVTPCSSDGLGESVTDGVVVRVFEHFNTVGHLQVFPTVALGWIGFLLVLPCHDPHITAGLRTNKFDGILQFLTFFGCERKPSPVPRHGNGACALQTVVGVHLVVEHGVDHGQGVWEGHGTHYTMRVQRLHKLVVLQKLCCHDLCFTVGSVQDCVVSIQIAVRFDEKLEIAIPGTGGTEVIVLRS